MDPKEFVSINLKNTVISVLGVVNMFIVNLFGGFSVLLYLVIMLMFLDLISKCYAVSAREDTKVENDKLMYGLKKKFGLVLLIVLALIVDCGLNIVVGTVGEYIEITLPNITAIMPLTLAWLFVKEAYSICENLVYGGVKVPSIITKALTSTESAIEQATGGTANGTGGKESTIKISDSAGPYNQ